MRRREGPGRVGETWSRARFFGAAFVLAILGCMVLVGAATFAPPASDAVLSQTAPATPADTPGTPAAEVPLIAQQLPTGMTLDLLAHESGAFTVGGSAAAFRLDRVALPSGAETSPHAVGAPDVLVPELLLVEIGAVELRDELGLTTTLTPGVRFRVNAGATYTLRNPGAEPATLLRLGLSLPANDVLGTPVAAPASSASITTLLEGMVEGPLGDGSSTQFTMFIGRATFQPGFDVPVDGHNGPVGFLVESGTLSVAGPSGVEGQLTAGTGVVMPAYRSYRQRNVGTEPVSALMIGYVFADTTLYPAFAPDPVATATPEPLPLSEAIVGRWELRDRDGYVTASLVWTDDGRFRLDDDGDVSFGQYHVVDETRVQMVSLSDLGRYDVTVAEDRLTFVDDDLVLYRVIDGVSTQPQPVEANAQNVIQGTWSNSAETWTFYNDGTVTLLDRDDGETSVGNYWFLDYDTVRLDFFGSVVTDVTITQLEGSPDEMELIIDGDTYTYERESY